MKGSVPKEVPQKLVARIEQEHKICKAKKVQLSAVCAASTAAPASAAAVTRMTAQTFDEAKSTKARKRKERQESVSSLCQERKVIRSNSEERPHPTKCTDSKSTSIRRVSSSGDFPKSEGEDKNGHSPNRIPLSDKTLTYDDHEHERRRSHERFARPHTLKSKKYPGKRFKVRCVSKVKVKSEMVCSEREVLKKTISNGNTDLEQHSIITHAEFKDQDSLNSTNFLSLRPVDIDRSPSPTHTPISPVLDFSTLHEQIDCNEPVVSRPIQVEENTETLPSLSVATNRLLSSPRNSIIATHRIYLDPDVPQTNSSLEKIIQNPIEEKVQKITKHINSYKKKIKAYEAEFEVKNGYKPSQIDKLNDGTLRKYYTELSKLKKEQKQFSEISANCPMIDLTGKMIQSIKAISLKDTVNEIEQKLLQKRESGKRGFNLETMTSEQLMDEKVAMQKALLFLESIHGRPQIKQDRDLVRPFYDRYRILKRMVAKNSISGPIGELATIHENEAMHFVTPTSSSNDTESEQTEYVPPSGPTPTNNTDSETDTSLSEKLHSMSKMELLEQLRLTTEEKKVLKRKIKEFELNLQAKSGKMLSKEDKVPMEHVYAAYRATKSRLKLLEALVSKQ